MTKNEHFIYRCITEVLGPRKRRHITETCRVLYRIYTNEYVFKCAYQLAMHYLPLSNRTDFTQRISENDLKIFLLKQYITVNCEKINSGHTSFYLSSSHQIMLEGWIHMYVANRVLNN